LVFARKTDDALASLVKKLDAEIGKIGKPKAAAVVIFLSDDDDMKAKIESFKKANEVKNVSLALESSKGPEDYEIAKEASVTTVLYKSKKVKVNHAYASFTAKDVETVVTDLSKLTQE
jgi:hypothetical protein